MDYRNIVLVGLLLSLGHTVSGQNCTTLLDTCQASVKSVPDSLVTPTPSSEINQCDSIELKETLCNSYKNFWHCVNSTLASCHSDPVINRELGALRFAYDHYCSREAMCGNGIGKCSCSTGIYTPNTIASSFCENRGRFQDCFQKMQDCEGTIPVQQAGLFMNMTEAVCKTACPISFTCWMGSFSLGGYERANSGNFCSDLAPRFQCLVYNTKSCSGSLSDKWRRTEASYREVCEVFQRYMTDPSPCSRIQACINKIEVITGVTLDVWITDPEVIFRRVDEFVRAIFNPGTWCSILKHSMDCVVQEADACSVSPAEKAEAIKLQSVVGDLCKDTDAGDEARQPTSGSGKTYPFFIANFLMAAFGLRMVDPHLDI